MNLHKYIIVLSTLSPGMAPAAIHTVAPSFNNGIGQGNVTSTAAEMITGLTITIGDQTTTLAVDAPPPPEDKRYNPYTYTVTPNVPFPITAGAGWYNCTHARSSGSVNNDIINYNADQIGMMPTGSYPGSHWDVHDITPSYPNGAATNGAIQPMNIIVPFAPAFYYAGADGTITTTCESTVSYYATPSDTTPTRKKVGFTTTYRYRYTSPAIAHFNGTADSADGSWDAKLLVSTNIYGTTTISFSGSYHGDITISNLEGGKQITIPLGDSIQYSRPRDDLLEFSPQRSAWFYIHGDHAPMGTSTITANVLVEMP